MQFNVLVWNPIARRRLTFMRFPVTSQSVSVTDDLGKTISAQVCHVVVVIIFQLFEPKIHVDK